MSRFFSSLNSSSSSGSDSEDGSLFTTTATTTKMSTATSMSSSSNRGGFFFEQQENTHCSFSSEDEFGTTTSSEEEDGESGAAAGNAAAGTATAKKSKFAFDYSDDSDDDSTQRVSIKSAREKVRDELDTMIDLILDELESFEQEDVDVDVEAEDKEEHGSDETPQATTTTTNFTYVNDEFEKICKIISKPSYLSSLAMEEDSSEVFQGIFGLLFPKIEAITARTSQSQIRHMTATDAKSFNALRQRIKKATKIFEGEVETALQRMEDDSAAAADSNTTSNITSTTTSKTMKGKAGHEDEDIVLEEDMTITPALIPLILKEIVSLRGKKGVDRHLNISVLQRIIKTIRSSSSKVPSLPQARFAVHAGFAVLSNSFDICNSILLSTNAANSAAPFTTNQSGGAISLSPECIQYLLGRGEELFELMQEMDALLGSSLSDAAGDSADEALGLSTLSALRCTLLSYCNRIDDEWIKGVQACSSSNSSGGAGDCSSEYLCLLKMEKSLFSFLQRVKESISPDQKEFISALTVRQLEHSYTKPSSLLEKHFNPSFMDMIQYLYCNGSTPAEPSSQQARALLYHTYHLIIEGKGSSARLLLAESGLVDLISGLDISLQILYNRCLVLLGLCSFGEGKLREAYHSLQDICGSGRTRELLGQAPFLGANARNKELSFTQEQERQEKSRLIAYHMQINVELIDTVFLTTSLLLEIPQMAAVSRRHFMGMDLLAAGGAGNDTMSSKKRDSSFDKKPFNCRHLKRIIDGADRQPYGGGGVLAENCRDRIILAYNYMLKGEWKKCEQEILAMESFSLLSGMLVIDFSSLKKMISFKVKESAIYYFIYSIGPNCKNLSLLWMAKHFEVDIDLLRSIIGELINSYGLPATMDEGCLMWKLDAKSSLSDKAIDNLIQIKEKVNLIGERRKDIGDGLTTLKTLFAKNQRLQEEGLASEE